MCSEKNGVVLLVVGLYANKCSEAAEMGSRLATIDMGRKLGAEIGGCAPLFGGAGSPSDTNVAWAEAYLRTKLHLDPSSRLTTIDMGEKVGAVPLFRGRWVPHLAQCRLDRGLYLRFKWHLEPSSRFAKTDMSRKFGEAVPLWGRRLGPHLTLCGQGRGLPPCRVLS